ncbi:MAG: pyruvate dehydrogenase [Bacteroidetes bacterium]|nr:pyruvate dehydrogenase [Bacteroidota bacterium]
MNTDLAQEASGSAVEKKPAIESIDWIRVARLSLISRALDSIEETRLVPEGKVRYQFSARGHEVAQILLGSQLTHHRDGVGAYYRSRPLLLSVGLSVEDAFAAPMTRASSYSNGRDIGVVCNLPRKNGPTVLPMAGDVGSQFTPAVGWAQSIVYRREQLNDESFDGAIAVVTGGDASVATNGFWSALTMATTLKLPVLFFVEDNGFGISVPSSLQTPGGNIAANLASFDSLKVVDGDGTDPESCIRLIDESVQHVRDGHGPALLRLTVPRLCGHSGQDNQAYKSDELLAEEMSRDPLQKLREYLIETRLSEGAWKALEEETNRYVERMLERATERVGPDASQVRRYAFAEIGETGSIEPPLQGGLLADGVVLPEGSEEPEPTGSRINMVSAIRRTLEHELELNERLVVFGEDVGLKGGVHTATQGLQDRFGIGRVFDTSLSEEGIIGRAVGMALGGLMPVAEIQFRKYADPATEQLNNCGTIRWRTNNRFAAPIVVRMPGGFAKVGDPWHSVTNESQFAHAVGWKVAVPSNAEDAVGLLRTAMRGHDPVIFFEHRALLDAASARRPYPGDDFVIPFGSANVVQAGDDLTIVTWGSMVERCVDAAAATGISTEIIDLRTLVPWDVECVVASVTQTKRALVVHEEPITAGFGAEVVATIVERCFFELDAPISRLAVPDIPIPHDPGLMDAVVPTVQRISERIIELVTL